MNVPSPLLLAAPNVSEGRKPGFVGELARAISAHGPAPASSTRADAGRQSGGGHEIGGSGAKLLDVHRDADHNRSVFTFAARQGDLAEAMLRLAAEVVTRVDVMHERSPGKHPHVGALDVAPVVYLQRSARAAACAEALVIADRVGCELGVPVFLYGELAGGRTRAELRRGGAGLLSKRLAAVDESALAADFGPQRLHPSAGATLVGAREPLVAFNLVLAPPADGELARAIASTIRERGSEGLPGVRAIGIELGDGAGQVSMNVERPLEVPLAAVAAAVARHARIASAEIVGLVPRAALEGFPQDIVLAGFDPERHVVENALRCCRGADQA